MNMLFHCSLQLPQRKLLMSVRDAQTEFQMSEEMRNALDTEQINAQRHTDSDTGKLYADRSSDAGDSGDKPGLVASFNCHFT